MNSITSYHCCAALVVGLLFGVAQAPAQYTPAPRDYAAYRLLLDDGTGNGFYGILRLSGSLSNHRYYNLPANASGDFIFSNSIGGQTLSGGLNVDMLTLATPLAPASGGTGVSGYAVGDLLYASGAATLSRLPIGANGQVLTVSGGLPVWSNPFSIVALPFGQLTNGTSTGQSSLEVGNGSALYPVGSGAITANRFITPASSTNAVDLATSEVSGILPDANVSDALTITGGSIDGTPIGSTTPSSGAFTGLEVIGTAGIANVRMGSLGGASLSGSYSPGINDGVIVADNNGDLLKRSFAEALNSTVWRTTGNIGTTAGTNFLGTIDNQAFEIRVNNAGAATGGNQRVMRFEPNATSPNIIGGFNGNSVTSGTVGAAIVSGGANGITNRVTDNYGTVVSGTNNQAGDNAGTTSDKPYATVIGGSGSIASGSYSTAMGYNAIASGDSATAIGSHTVASGQNSFASGYQSVASGWLATAMGDSTVASAYAATAFGSRTIASGFYSTAMGLATTASGNFSTAMGVGTVVAGDLSIGTGFGLTLDASADRSFGFHANNSIGTLPMTISTPDVAIFGNADLWLANNDGAASELRFFEDYNTAGAFPNTANYTAFKAQTQTGDITYTLPAANGTAGQVLTIASSPTPTGVAATLQWAAPGTGWLLSGNAGTPPGTNFIGTTDNQPFEIRVNNAGAATGGNQRVMRFEPNATSPNIIGGFNGNSVTSGAVGATIAGGGRNGATNRATDNYGVVGGGENNRAGDNAGTTTDHTHATVGGGFGNTASGIYSTLGGGFTNTASGEHSAVGGGFSNTASGNLSTLGGGSTNTASGIYSAISGGFTNTASGYIATVGGGFLNTVAGDYSAIVGGYGLTLDAAADRSFGFHTNNSGGTRNMTISASNVAVFGNADLWLANNDGAASELRFFEDYNTAGAFPNTANYTAFKAQTQTGNITYTLPASAPTSDGQILTSTALGTMSWGRKITKATVTQNIASVAANSRITETFTVTGVAVGGSVAVSPSGDLTAGLVISYARVSASNTVTVAFQNVTGAAIDEGSLDWDITIIE
ncbi:MAG: hypothetical protein IT211_12990 [Armatimonadetes bacterium]|nr:hypothetical protein [Armatimonadota bacterium]